MLIKNQLLYQIELRQQPKIAKTWQTHMIDRGKMEVNCRCCARLGRMGTRSKENAGTSHCGTIGRANKG